MQRTYLFVSGYALLVISVIILTLPVVLHRSQPSDMLAASAAFGIGILAVRKAKKLGHN
jgi:hypothetical protein